MEIKPKLDGLVSSSCSSPTRKLSTGRVRHDHDRVT